MKKILFTITILIISINAFAEKITVWGPPVAPTVTLVAAKEYGKANKIYPFEIKVWRSPDELKAGLLNKNINITMVPSYVAANLYNKGMQVKLENIMTTGLLYLVSKEDNIKTLADLKNKKILMPFKNDLPDLVFKLLIQHNNIDNLDINYVATPMEGASLFLSKDYDAIILPEPFATMVITKAKAQHLNSYRNLDLQKLWKKSFPLDFDKGTKLVNGYPQAGLMVTKEFTDKNNDFLKIFNQDLIEANNWVLKNPTKAAELSTKYLKVPTPILEKSLPYSNLVVINAKENKVQILDFYKKLISINPNIIGGKLPDDKIFD